ncbi:MAG: 4Fe-4S binding protein [Oscillospiraceae bacterium]|nr:4Fe-4S binding protein [Oscillospiraceae bacterium]
MYVTIDEHKCTGCNACIRTCRVNDANIAKKSADGKKSIISIDPTKCIGCGECVKKCVHGARNYIDDTEKFFSDLRANMDITVLVAPAFRLTEPNADRMLWQLRGLGVKRIYDVSFGADICTYMHIKAVKEKRVGKIMSQPCAALTEYILKHKHNLIPSLSPIHSPISCAAVYLRKYEGISGPIAVISPCIAKKFEFEETGLVQYNVTYKRLVEYLSGTNVSVPNQPFQFDGMQSYCGKIYPKPGGLRECLLHAVPTLNVRNAEGVDHVYHELDIYAKAPENCKPDVYDILSCANGCISGPGTNFDENRLFNYLSNASVTTANEFRRRESQTSFKSDKQFAWFAKHLRIEDFIRKYEAKNVGKIDVSAYQLEGAYASLGKSTHSEKTFDCHACGYNSCKEMAIAIARGLNYPENCHQYAAKMAEIAKTEIQQAQTVANERNSQIIKAADEISTEISTIHNNTLKIVADCTEADTSMSNVKIHLDDLVTKVEEINVAIADVVEVNKKYQQMAELIKNITDQTHILSTNASIEAARAGAAGKSFAIVAGEIRTLAANTRQTTEIVAENNSIVSKDTKIIMDIASDISNTVQEVSEKIAELNQTIAVTTQTSNEISCEVDNIQNTAQALLAHQ